MNDDTISAASSDGRPHQRRVRYRGRNPRRYEEKYKELDPALDPETVAKVIASGKTPAGQHRPILVAEIVKQLAPQPGERGADVTFGYGGHSERLLECLSPGGQLLVLDVDAKQLPVTEARLRALGFGEDALVVRRSNYAGLSNVLAQIGWTDGVDFLLADLGLSSMQIDNPARGFSYKHDGPLDMRMNPERGLPARDWLARCPLKKLARTLAENGDEPQAEAIAEAIVGFLEQAPIDTTGRLRRVIEKSLPDYVDDEERSATVARVFQAIRIAVNEELTALDAFLARLPGCLKPNGRVASLRRRPACEAPFPRGIPQRNLQRRGAGSHPPDSGRGRQQPARGSREDALGSAEGLTQSSMQPIIGSHLSIRSRGFLSQSKPMKLMQRNVEDAAAIRILSRPQDQAGDAADYAYRHILRRIREARATIEIHMYVWRADAVGHLVGQAVLEAAERGVRVTVFKDSGAALFEGQESNRKPFFRTEQPLLRRVSQRLVGMTLPDSRVRDDWDQTMGERLRAHPNVDFHWVSPTHTKYYCIDERYVITGSLNLEDRHRGYHDVMAEISGEEAVRVFREAQRTSLATDSDGALSVLVNLPEKGAFPIKSAVLRLIEDARMSIHIEMAYIGEEDITRALVAASNRGVRLSILFSAKANIGNDANYHTLRRMMEQTAIDVRISDKMIHSKLMVVDDMKAVLGSANFSIFSMQRAGELCLLSKNDTPLLRQLLPIVEARWALGRPMRDVRSLPPYSRILARLQQWHQRVCSHK